jgi:hypothetical protein
VGPAAEVKDRAGYSSGWPAYAAFCIGFLFTLVNVYWLAGGELGLDTLGHAVAADARRGAPSIVAATVIKAAGAVFPLALVRHWGRLFPRLLLAAAGWTGAVLLVLYGGALTLGEALTELGAFHLAPADPTALHGHLYVWDPWFLLWGVLLALATARFERAALR